MALSPWDEMIKKKDKLYRFLIVKIKFILKEKNGQIEKNAFKSTIPRRKTNLFRTFLIFITNKSWKTVN